MQAGSDNPTARSEQLIRRPVDEVFASFVEPDRLVRFWLARASGPLRLGGRVNWEFKVPGAASEVEVLALEPNRRILLRWTDHTQTEWTFSKHGTDGTVVTVAQSGFAGTSEEVIATVIEATQGYTLVLGDLKVLLESGRSPGLVADKARLIEESMAGPER
jgi:uncharacterized protein YndB with AHSA1/START domain